MYSCRLFANIVPQCSHIMCLIMQYHLSYAMVQMLGSENSETIERVQYTFCKKMLRVSSNTTHADVLGETGR
jgi:hypothetical protein